MPLQRPVTLSPRRKLSAKHSIYISPLKASVIPNSPHSMRYSFNRSPSKDLQAINACLWREQSRKRASSFDASSGEVADVAMAPPPPKFAVTVETTGAARKIQFH